MEIKAITKRMHSDLDEYVSKKKESPVVADEINPTKRNSKKNKLKKNDGLIERIEVGEKLFIAEDNRQLLND